MVNIDIALDDSEWFHILKLIEADINRGRSINITKFNIKIYDKIHKPYMEVANEIY